MQRCSSEYLYIEAMVIDELSGRELQKKFSFVRITSSDSYREMGRIIFPLDLNGVLSI